MDLLSTIRKEGSRGGVDFKWSDVSTSQHRENYLGHSLMAPVGRWQKGRDLNWYAKADSGVKVLGKDGQEETDAERQARERKEEIRRIKEAEEDALARALGLPVPERNTTGANSIDVGEMNRMIKETEAGDGEIEEVGKAPGFGDFVGKVSGAENARDPGQTNDLEGGLVGRGNRGSGGRGRGDRGKEEPRSERDRSRSRERERRRRHRRHRSRSREGRERHRHRDARERSRSYDRRDRHSDVRGERPARDMPRSRTPERTHRRHRTRSRSYERPRQRRDSAERSPRRDNLRGRDHSRSPRRDERSYRGR